MVHIDKLKVLNTCHFAVANVVKIESKIKVIGNKMRDKKIKLIIY